VGLEAFDIFKGVTKVARSGKNVKSAVDSGDWRDWVTTATPIATLGADLVGKNMKNVATGATKDAYKELADILGWASTIISLLEFTLLGWGSPEKGKDIKAAGSTSLKAAYENLQDAVSDEWEGDAADAYAKQVSLQQERVDKIKKIDKELLEIMSINADQLTNLRLGFTVSQDFLSMMTPPALALLTAPPPPPPNKIASNSFQFGVVFIVSAYIIGHITSMAANANANAARVQKVIGDYNTLATGAVVPPDPFKGAPQQSAARQSVVSSISSSGAISERMSEFAMPAVATLANTPEARASMSAQQQAFMDALTGGGADAETPADTPAPTPPSLSDTSKASGQLRQIISEPVNLQNQSIQRIQQLAAMGRQGQAAAAPAKAAEKLAAAGTGDAERAPVDVTTVGTRQAQEPSPVQRNG
jgi:hypothetical protein